MRLLRFQGTGINGYLDFDFDFFRDLTFLTGINGTGKTSALNSISALLMPRLDYLATHEFTNMSLSIEHAGEQVVLWADKFGASEKIGSTDRRRDQTVLTCSKFPDDMIDFEAFEPSNEFPSYKHAEHENEYYKALNDLHADDAIMQFIFDLPTPMFLGLDRRSRSLTTERPYTRRPSAHTHRKRNVFSSSLNGSLIEAESHAQSKIVECFRSKTILDRNFRNDLIMEVLNLPTLTASDFFDLNDIVSTESIQEAKKNIYRIPELLNFQEGGAMPSISHLFDFIEEQVEIAQRPADPEYENEPWNDPRFQARLNLDKNQPSIEKINTLSRMVSEYTQELKGAFEGINKFLEIINSFIRDSKKSIDYNDIGELFFRVGGEATERELRTLSSGEIQLIVIFAHLYFNPETETANVFIIDEPELSLHVQWQAKFVDAVLAASERTQFVMATHSPTVIMGRVDNCKEITTA